MIFPGVPDGLLWTTLLAVVVLAIGSVARWLTLRGETAEKSRERLASLRSWWIVALVVLAASLAGRLAVVVLLAVISLLAIAEWIAVPLQPPLRPRLSRVAYGLAAVGFIFLAFHWDAYFQVTVPLLAIVLPGILLIVSGDATGAVTQVSRTSFAILLLVYALGHAGLLVCLPPEWNPVAGPTGWFLFLVALTQINDIAQALVGRRFGQRKLTPISPNKTWEGFFGGAVITVIVAVGLGWMLTPMSPGAAVVSGLIIAVAGLLGDLNMSLIKRDAGVKASGQMVPGQGGILDRIDSLTFTAPAFYFFVRAYNGPLG